MQCPLCNRTYNSGKFCTSCESPDGGAVRLVEGQKTVNPDDLDQYIKMLDVFLSDGFLGADEKTTLEDLRRQFGISEQQHQSILTENGYKYRETMPVRMVLNRKTIQGYGAGQPCLAKVRLVNTERMPLQQVEIRYWLNSEEVHTSTLRQLMSNKVYEVDLDFRPSESGQYALKMELTVDPFIGDKTEYVVESTSFQVYSQAQLQSVHIHQSGENIVGNNKVHGTDMPKAMLLGDGQWDELTLSPKQQAVEWGEWSAQRLFEKVNPIIEQATQKYGSEPEWQRFLREYPVNRIPNEDFIVWEARLKGLETKKNAVISTVKARLDTERKQKEVEERQQRETEEKRQRALKAEQERKDREEAERKHREVHKQTQRPKPYFVDQRGVSIQTRGFAVRKPINGLMVSYYYDLLKDGSWGYQQGNNGILKVDVHSDKVYVTAYEAGVTYNNTPLSQGVLVEISQAGQLQTSIGQILVVGMNNRDYRWLLVGAPTQPQEANVGDIVELGREPGHPGYLLSERVHNRGIVWAASDNAKLAARSGYTLDRIIIGRQQARVSIDSPDRFTLSSVHKRIPTLVVNQDVVLTVSVSNPISIQPNALFIVGT